MHPGCRIDQVFLCREPVDFRKSISGLSVLVEQELGLDPFGSALYVFVNRDRNKIKVLYWHRNGSSASRPRSSPGRAMPTAPRKGSRCSNSSGCWRVSIYGRNRPIKPCISVLFHRGIW
jgi:transposase